jgi:hypothetical protein
MPHFIFRRQARRMVWHIADEMDSLIGADWARR